MKIDVDFSQLKKTAARIARKESDFAVSLDQYRFTEVDTLLEEGIDVGIEELDFSTGIASYKGRQVLLYIPDHGSSLDKVIKDPTQGRRFHVSWCATMEDMLNKKRIDRYTATNDLSGNFTISGSRYYRGPVEQADVPLSVCMNCLRKLNYKGYRTTRNPAAVFQNFSIPEFFETYSSLFKFMPRSFRMEQQDYSKDWQEVSKRAREAVSYICQGCHIDLNSHRHILHVHHINGVKGDNTPSNLKPLCADCHRKEPLHEHIHVKREEMAIITKLRKQQPSITNVDWDEVMANADTSVHGVLDLAKHRGWKMPEIGFEPQKENGEVAAMFEVAWPERRFAVVLTDEDKINLPGWRIKTVDEVLETDF